MFSMPIKFGINIFGATLIIANSSWAQELQAVATGKILSSQSTINQESQGKANGSGAISQTPAALKVNGIEGAVNTRKQQKAGAASNAETSETDFKDMNTSYHAKSQWSLDTDTRPKNVGLNSTFKQAYITNPQLNAQRANTRGIDENLQIALGSFMPKIYGQATALTQNFNLLSPRYDQSAFGLDGVDLKTHPTPVYAGVTASLNVFNGFKGVNGVNQAEAQIHQSRELLRASELSVFLAAVQSYMSVLNDTAIFNIRQNYVQVVREQLLVSQEKVKAGEISSTDIHEIESYLAQGERNTIASNTLLQASIAFYKRVTGLAPVSLSPANPIDDKLPKTLDGAINQGFSRHPLVVAARYNVDINKYAVKIAESGLLPTVD